MLKMSLACESEIRVQNENALRFSLVSHPPPVLDYVKAISSLVGASHILAVFEETDNLKIFFDDKHYVDTLIRSGVHVMGRHVRIDYVIPPGVKIILSNVDPVLSNCDISRLLSCYGSVVSPIIRPPICDDAELCHIGYGVRYAYMILHDNLPAKVEIKCGDQLYTIKLKVEDKPELFGFPHLKEEVDESSNDALNYVIPYNPVIASTDAVPGPSGIDTNSNNSEMSEPVVLSIESAASTILPQIESSESLKSEAICVPRRRGRPKMNKLMTGGRNVTATARAARKIQKNFRNKFMVGKRHYRKRTGYKSDRKSVAEFTLPPVLEVSPSSSVTSEPAECPNLQAEEEAYCINSPAISVLEPQELLSFLDEVKHQRAPLELAKKYLGEDCDKDKILNFIHQLYQYKESQNHHNLKLRISRIIKCIKDAL